jgi:hypothetical protein
MFYSFYFDHFLIRALDQWENLVYRGVPKVFAISNEVPRTSSPRLPPLAHALLRPLLFCRRCQHRFPGHVPSPGRSPAPPPALSRSMRHRDAGHRPSSSSLALSRACHAAPRLGRPPPRRRSGCLCMPPRPFFSDSRVQNTTAASFLNSSDLLLAVGNPLQSTPHHYDRLGSFPSPH